MMNLRKRRSIRGGILFLLAMACLPTWADDGNTNTWYSTPQDVNNLKGIDLSKLSSYVSDANPGDLTDAEARKKWVVLYNVGQKKFLNMGGWWGTKPTLSDVPRLFWLQQHTNKVGNVETASEYYTYPTQAGTSVSVSPLGIIQDLTGGKIQVGSVQGAVRSHATYNSVTLQKANGTKRELFLKSDMGDGKAFSTDVNVDFAAGDKIIASVNLPETTTGTETDKTQPENILSLGDSIQYWGQSGVDDKHNAHNIHIF